MQRCLLLYQLCNFEIYTGVKIFLQSVSTSRVEEDNLRYVQSLILQKNEIN